MIFSIIFVIGAIHGVALAVLLSVKKVNQLSNRILGALMLVFSIDLFMAAFSNAGLQTEYPHLIGLDMPITLLYAPLLFLYAETLTRGGKHLNRYELIHFVPAVLLLIYTIPFYLMPAEDKLATLTENGNPDYGPEFLTHFKLIFNLLYIPFILSILRKYRKQIRDSYSTIEKRNLDWLQTFLVAFLILAVVSVVIHLMNFFSGALDTYANFMLLSVTIFVYSIGYIGLSRAEFFTSTEADIDKIETGNESNQYSKSGLKEETGKELMEKLRNTMEADKPYLNSELSLRDLAGIMDITPHNLTEIINRFAEMNFYDFVNGYRVDEVKRRIESGDYELMTLLAIGLDSGFNSKSSFNSVFKKHTGLTPTQFKKSLN